MYLYRRDASFWTNSKPTGKGFTVYHVMGPHKNRLGGQTAACDIRIMLDEDNYSDVHDVPVGLRCSRAACKRQVADFIVGESMLDAATKKQWSPR